MLSLLRKLTSAAPLRREVIRGFQCTASRNSRQTDDPTEIRIPDYKVSVNETTDVKRARLLYQSRKRGMLENDLLLGTFVDKYLFSWDSQLLSQYDKLINCPYSDWDIYYWAIGSRPVPPEYDNEIMSLLQNHVQNKSKEKRIRQPDLPLQQINKL